MIPVCHSYASESRIRVETIRDGLANASEPVDAATWRIVAERRIANLEVEQATFGLDEHEEWELQQLQRLLEGELTDG